MLEKYKNGLIAASANLKTAKSKLKQRKDHHEFLLGHLKDLTTAHSVFQTAIKLTQDTLESQVSSIVSEGLKIVFDNPYGFRAKFVERRNTTECDLLFTDGEDEFDPLESCGYGTVDIGSFCLRVSYRELFGEENRALLIYDEPMRFLSKDKQPFAGQMIREISDKRKTQFLIATHEEALIACADKLWEVEILNGKSEAFEMEEQ